MPEKTPDKTPTGPTLAEVMAELAGLEDPRIRAVNEKHGDDHGVHLTKLRALAKRLKTQPELARTLWATDDTAARLLALLVCRPKSYGRDELDTMLRQARTPKVHDWLVNYVVKKNPHAEELRVAWTANPDPVVASAGWALTTERVTRNPAGLDLPALLDTVESEMSDAPDRLRRGTQCRVGLRALLVDEHTSFAGAAGATRGACVGAYRRLCHVGCPPSRDTVSHVLSSNHRS